MAGAIADILIGTAIAVQRASPLGLYAAWAISFFYVIVGTAILFPGCGSGLSAR